MGVGNACGGFHLLLCGVVYTECDVVEDGVIEKDGLLVDVSNQASQTFQTQVANVFPVDADGAFAYIVVTRNQIHQCAFSASALSNQGYGLALGNGQIDIVQDSTAFRITEVHVLNTNLVLQAFDGLRVLNLADVVLGIQYLVDSLHAGQTFLHGVGGLAEVLDGLERGVQDNQIIDEQIGVYCAVSGKNEPSSEPQDNDNHACAQELADWMGSALAYGHSVGNVAVLVVDLNETGKHLLFGNERLDDAQTAQRLFNLAHAVAQFFLHLQ